MAKRSKGTVGVVGLGNMGGAFARHLAAAGWRVLGFDIDAARKRAATRAGVEVVPDVADARRGRAPTIILSLPNVPRARGDRGRDHQATSCRADDRRDLDLRHRGQGACRGGAAQGRPRMLDCPVSGTGAQAARSRTSSSMRAARRRAIAALQADVRGVLPRGLRCRRIRQRQPDEIHRQPSRHHPQRVDGRGDGARHQGRARSADGL